MRAAQHQRQGNMPSTVRTALGLFPQYPSAHTPQRHVAQKSEYMQHHHEPQTSHQQGMYRPVTPQRMGAFPLGANAFANSANVHGAPHTAPVNRTQPATLNHVHTNNNNNGNNNNLARANNEPKHHAYNHPQPAGMPHESLNANDSHMTPNKPARGGRAGGRRGAHNTANVLPPEHVIQHRGSPVLGPQATANLHNQPQFEQHAHTYGSMPGYGNRPQNPGSPSNMNREGTMMRGQPQNSRSRAKRGA